MGLFRMVRWLAFSVFVLGGACQGYSKDPAQRQKELDERIKPLLAKHCLDCHSGAEPDAGLTLNHFDKPIDLLKGRSIWEKAIQKMQIEEMPPPESSSLSAEERTFLIDWLTQAINDIECGLTPNPGQVTLRRLNSTEYQNSIRDLLGVNYTPAKDFPGDDVGYGFDNIGDVLTLPPILMEKYFLAAEQISRYAIKAPPPAQTFEAAYAGSQLSLTDGNNDGSTGSRTLASQNEAYFEEQIPWAGTYQLKITASGDQAGDEPCLMSIVVDDKLLTRVAVKNEREQPQDFTYPLRLRAGKRKIAIGFLNDFYVAGTDSTPQQDRNLCIEHVTLLGSKPSQEKIDPAQATELHKTLIAAQAKFAPDTRKIAQAFLDQLASRAFRRPVSKEVLGELVDLVVSVEEDGGSIEEGVQVALQAILISPKFLFRVEPPREDTAAGNVRELDQFELASRLSYFLWSSMPDTELFKLAWDKKLKDPGVLEQQIARMIKDRKSNAFVEQFAGQWLTLRKLRNFQPNPTSFPRWNDRIKELAEQETLTFFAGVMRHDESVLRLLDADYTYVNEELARYYGMKGVTGDGFRKVSLQGSPRSGLLTHASILAVTSNPTRTSPVKRGKWILENLLATPPPPAPPGVPELKEKGALTGTLRQQLEQHRADPACASCHKLMDPLGFALENYDAVGQYRTHDGAAQIDASGELPSGQVVKGAAELRDVLMTKHRDEFVECLTEKMLTYALGRGLEYYDKCAVDRIVAAMEQNDNKFSTLLIEIVKSDPFQKKGSREL